MILIIDGYNLLNQIYKQKQISQNQFDVFIKKIEDYAISKKHTAIIVFDGYDIWDTYKHNVKHLTFVFSKEISADDYIKEFIEKNKSKDLIVVSSDSEIYQAAAALGIVTIESDAFALNLKQFGMKGSKPSTKKLEGQIYKISEEENPELDILMEESSEVPCYKIEQEYSAENDQPKSKKLSKSEKKILKISKKL